MPQTSVKPGIGTAPMIGSSVIPTVPRGGCVGCSVYCIDPPVTLKAMELGRDRSTSTKTEHRRQRGPGLARTRAQQRDEREIKKRSQGNGKASASAGRRMQGRTASDIFHAWYDADPRSQIGDQLRFSFLETQGCVGVRGERLCEICPNCRGRPGGNEGRRICFEHGRQRAAEPARGKSSQEARTRIRG